MSSALLLLAAVGASVGGVATTAALSPVRAPTPAEGIASAHKCGDVAMSRPTVLLVPGLGAGTWIYDDLRRRLVGSASAIEAKTIVDLADANASPGQIVRSATANLARHIAAHSGPLILVGHSLGGAIALAAAEKRPRHLCGLIVLDAGPRPVAAADRGRMEREIAIDAEAMVPATAGREAEAIIIQWVSEMTTRASDRARLVADFLGSDRSRLRAVLAEGRNLQLRLDPHRIDVPILVLFACGDETDCAAARDNFSTRYARSPNVLVEEIPDSRHFVMLDQPAMVAASIRRFLSQCPPAIPIDLHHSANKDPP